MSKRLLVRGSCSPLAEAEALHLLPFRAKNDTSCSHASFATRERRPRPRPSRDYFFLQSWIQQDGKPTAKATATAHCLVAPFCGERAFPPVGDPGNSCPGSPWPLHARSTFRSPVAAMPTNKRIYNKQRRDALEHVVQELEDIIAAGAPPPGTSPLGVQSYGPSDPFCTSSMRKAVSVFSQAPPFACGYGLASASADGLCPFGPSASHAAVMKAPPASEQGDAAGTFWASSRNFGQLPLSQETKDGLKAAKYKAMTAIQRAVSSAAGNGEAGAGGEVGPPGLSLPRGQPLTAWPLYAGDSARSGRTGHPRCRQDRQREDPSLPHPGKDISPAQPAHLLLREPCARRAPRLLTHTCPLPLR